MLGDSMLVVHVQHRTEASYQPTKSSNTKISISLQPNPLLYCGNLAKSSGCS